jgi:hypothetical protein
MDRSGWARRADLSLRADYPHLHTRIFEITPDRFTIVFDESLQKSEGFDVDEIRPITLPLTVSNKVPDTFLRELPIIPDADLVQHFNGFSFSANDLFNLIGSKFAHLPIIGFHEGKYPDVACTIEVSNSLDLEQEKELLDFCKNLGTIVPFVIEVVEQNQTRRTAHPQLKFDALEVRPSRVRPQLPPFVRADEKFWFQNIELFAHGKLGLHQFPGIVDDQSRCFIDATVGSQLNLRQALLSFDTVYLSPPLAEKHEEFLASQALTDDDLLLLIEEGRLKLISTQAEERVNVQFLFAAHERSRAAFIGRRTTAAILLNDMAITAREYWWSHPRNAAALAEACIVLSKELQIPSTQVMRQIFWPIRAHRLALGPLLTRGSKAMAGMGIGRDFGDALKRHGKSEDTNIMCMIISERLHIAHALNATMFMGRHEPPPFGALANIMGDCLNGFRSCNTRLAAAWIGNQERKETDRRLLPAIPLLEFERAMPMKEFLAACNSFLLRNHGRSLLSRLSELPEEARASEVKRLAGELRKLGRPQGFISLDSADTLVSLASLIFGFFYPPVGGLRLLGSQIVEQLNKKPALAKTLQAITADLFGEHPEREALDFLSKISRVAILKTDRIS